MRKEAALQSGDTATDRWSQGVVLAVAELLVSESSASFLHLLRPVCSVALPRSQTLFSQPGRYTLILTEAQRSPVSRSLSQNCLQDHFKSKIPSELEDLQARLLLPGNRLEITARSS